MFSTRAPNACRSGRERFREKSHGTEQKPELNQVLRWFSR